MGTGALLQSELTGLVWLCQPPKCLICWVWLVLAVPGEWGQERASLQQGALAGHWWRDSGTGIGCSPSCCHQPWQGHSCSQQWHRVRSSSHAPELWVIGITLISVC